MTRKLSLLALLLPTIVLLGWVGCLTWRYNHAPAYDVVITGYDPRDIVYGKYLMFTFDWQNPQSSKPADVDMASLPTSGRFYVPEWDAMDLQTMIQRNEGHVFMANAALTGKNAMVRNLRIDGQPWQEALAAWRKTKQNGPQ
ncbi:MAG: hypothetical protein KGQ41_00180 [Alphaproteobacteria bacterium]|nr:hypothetical protein [Alphaproteobacteria bacterium]